MDNHKEITLIAGDKELKFNVGISEYNRYLDEMTMTDKVVTAENFLRRTLADKAQKPLLDELCNAGLTLELAGSVIQEFRPQVTITVKK